MGGGEDVAVAVTVGVLSSGADGVGEPVDVGVAVSSGSRRTGLSVGVAVAVGEGFLLRLSDGVAVIVGVAVLVGVGVVSNAGAALMTPLAVCVSLNCA